MAAGDVTAAVEPLVAEPMAAEPLVAEPMAVEPLAAGGVTEAADPSAVVAKPFGLTAGSSSENRVREIAVRGLKLRRLRRSFNGCWISSNSGPNSLRRWSRAPVA